jgi:hypothetical protein
MKCYEELGLFKFLMAHNVGKEPSINSNLNLFLSSLLGNYLQKHSETKILLHF